MPIQGWTDWLALATRIRQRLLPGNSANGRRSADRDAERTIGDAVTAWPSPADLFDASPNALLLLDQHLVILHWNAPAREALGAVRIGEHVSQSLRHPELTQALTRVQEGEPRAVFAMQIRGPIERQLQGSVTRLASQTEGRPARRGPATNAASTILVVLEDVSERDALARMRMEFVANASHELRTPLASLSGFIETLQGPAKDDPSARERFLRIMAEQAGRMRRLIDDLLLLSRVEMRAHVAPTDTVDLNAVVSDALKPLTGPAESGGATLAFAAFAPAPLVRGDHDELVQAVQNLIQNALKYGNPQGTVTVRVLAADGSGPPTASISVTDDGPGIAPEHLPRLTERFYRVSTAASREKGGTGLGLAIVKHIVTRHQGNLEIASEVGRGSTFSIHLPPAQS